MSNDLWPDPGFEGWFEGWEEGKVEQKLYFEWQCMGCGAIHTQDNMHCPCENERREDE